MAEAEAQARFASGVPPTPTRKRYGTKQEAWTEPEPEAPSPETPIAAAQSGGAFTRTVPARRQRTHTISGSRHDGLRASGSAEDGW